MNRISSDKNRQNYQELSLTPLKEDICQWLAKTLEIDISSETFLDVLDNGVYLCRLVKIIQSKAEECVKVGKFKEPLPNYKVRCKENAASGSWFARDNTTNFIQWCREYGIQDDCLFEAEDLVSYKYEKPVIVCLMELARLGYKFDLEPPTLIKMEKEIEKEEKLTEKEVAVKVVERPKSCVNNNKKLDSLDVKVRKVATKCGCLPYVKRIREGVYNIFGRVVFIRLLQGKHLMVRVGGGWDTLEHYLVTHEPQQIFEFRRAGSQDNLLDDAIDKKFLYMRAKYKSDTKST
ncbi:hypothetical protein SNE40_020547 [Patella caerulea]|uniref:Growth arrest-specific protein 2 n=1 Tax=Patella caerulea TaxID=87958 RepID=A0AAN8J0D9_PATCE